MAAKPSPPQPTKRSAQGDLSTPEALAFSQLPVLERVARLEEASTSLFEMVERAKQEWEATADSLPDLICLIDEQAHVLRANRTVERWNLGWVTSVRDLHVHDLIHPSCTDPGCYLLTFLEDVLHEAAGGKVAEVGAFDPILRRHLRVRTRPIRAEKSEAAQTTVVIAQDVSQQKQAEEALSRYTERLEILNEMQQAILAAQSPEQIARAALTRIQRLIPSERTTVYLWGSEPGQFSVLSADDDQETKTTIQRDPAILDQLPCTMSPGQLLLGGSNSLREMMLSYVSVPMIGKGKTVGSLNLGSSQRHAFSQQHISIAREVADVLAIAIHQARLASQLSDSNAGLRRALDAKAEMVRNVSHELRTPLSIIQAYVNALQEGLLGPLTPKQQEALDIVYSQGDRLFFMVNRLLTLQELNETVLERQVIRPDLLLQQTAQAWQLRAAQAGITLRLEIAQDLPYILVDTNLLGQVLHNLLDNAIKFSTKGGTVLVSAQMSKGQFLCQVSDQGVGIPTDELGRIFERFHQVQRGLNRSYSGMGIGLALSRAIVEAHEGRIWAESDGPLQGSTFSISLPIDHNTNDAPKRTNLPNGGDAKPLA